MESVYTYLSSINANRQADCTLGTIRRQVEDFAETNPDSMGSPPFTQFAQWIARKHFRSKKSLHGRWTRFDGGYWRIIEEEFGGGREAVEAFFQLLAEYQNQERRIVWVSQQEVPRSFDYDSKPNEFQIWEWIPGRGCDLAIRLSDGRTKIEGYFSSATDAMDFAKHKFDIDHDKWINKTKDNF